MRFMAVAACGKRINWFESRPRETGKAALGIRIGLVGLNPAYCLFF